MFDQLLPCRMAGAVVVGQPTPKSQSILDNAEQLPIYRNRRPSAAAVYAYEVTIVTSEFQKLVESGTSRLRNVFRNLNRGAKKIVAEASGTFFPTAGAVRSTWLAASSAILPTTDTLSRQPITPAILRRGALPGPAAASLFVRFLMTTNSSAPSSLFDLAERRRDNDGHAAPLLTFATIGCASARKTLAPLRGAASDIRPRHDFDMLFEVANSRKDLRRQWKRSVIRNDCGTLFRHDKRSLRRAVNR